MPPKITKGPPIVHTIHSSRMTLANSGNVIKEEEEKEEEKIDELEASVEGFFETLGKEL